MLRPADFRGYPVDLAARDLAREWNRRLRPSGLTYVPFFVLLLLAERERRPSDLAAELRLDASSLSGHLDRLAEQRYVERTPDAADRRATVVRLAPAGRALLAEYAEVAQALAAIEPDLSGTGGGVRDPATQAQRALAEVQDAVRNVTAALGALTTAAQGPSDAGEPGVLRVATMTAADAPGGRTLRRFAELVRERTRGAVRVELDVPYRESGGELRLLVDVRSGRLALIGVTAAVAGNLVRSAQLLELPYLFASRAHARRVMDGPLGAHIAAEIAQHGLLGLGIAANGLRSLTTRDVPVHVPADAAGMRLRTQQSPVNVYLAESLGAVAVPLPYERLREALRDGDVDAQENALANIADLEMWETQRYLTLTEHVHSALVLIGNPAALAALGPRRVVVETALRDAIADAAASAERDEAASLRTLADRMDVIHLDAGERAAFAAASALARERVGRALGDDVLERALRAIADARDPHPLTR